MRVDPSKPRRRASHPTTSFATTTVRRRRSLRLVASARRSTTTAEIVAGDPSTGEEEGYGRAYAPPSSSSGRTTGKKRSSSSSPAATTEEENESNNIGRTTRTSRYENKKRRRRDTFDLSARRRGLVVGTRREDDADPDADGRDHVVAKRAQTLVTSSIASSDEMQSPHHSGDAAIERIRTEFALCAAPLDAVLAEIVACEGTAQHETTPSSPPRRRTTSAADAEFDATSFDGAAAGEERTTRSTPSSFRIGMSEGGRAELSRALEEIALDAAAAAAVVDVVAGRTTPEDDDRRVVMPKVLQPLSSGRKGTRSSSSSSSPSAATGEEENETNGIPITTTTTTGRRTSSRSDSKRRRRRRDTFDLSGGRRGLAVVGARRTAGLSVLVDRTSAASNDANGGVDGRDYVTPKAGSVEVDVDAMFERISQTLLDGDDGDGRSEEDRRRDDDGEGAIDEEFVGAEDDSAAEAVMRNLDRLTSVVIEERMEVLFPDKMRQVHRYPCVSARIFAAMSAVYDDQANFSPLLPFFASLVDAEIVSLSSKDEGEVLFINKRVCFSGFDYSSTTTAIGAVVGQGGGDLGPSVEALEVVLRSALELTRPVHHLDIAIRCLRRMSSRIDACDACAGTMVGYFPSSRFRRALDHYANELKDVKRFLASRNDDRPGGEHAGVRYRLNDFIGRTIRYHLRESLNSIPANAVDFNVDKCAERWGRAVDDRSISSILNFALEKVHELATFQTEMFERGVQDMPVFFAREASARVHSLSRDELKRMDKFTFESLVMDVTEARAFLFGARACKFVLDLLNCSAVREHIDASGGWAAVEAMASTFYKLNLHESSENGHFVQLRVVRDLITMLEDFVCKVEGTVERCELCIRRLQGKLNFKTKSAFVHILKVHLAEEKGEYFPLVVAQ